ncbi:HIG1 domain family member 1A, mitochondrial-like [Vespa crabro]|uniref:HIG1 domain family member 1A, mitochondrial-like n=1 Tax=Vespa crabro TaxID=7445 RepID=UPI001F0257DA|nr:HIG1 domain family member 1A, mitochondrial-like [Vespa crabro]XP_046838727.1 HIG1 domain family member 1A, mitochondrial-like [Vespa crabro]
MDSKEEIVIYDESISDRAISHAKRNPFLMAGFASLIAACAIGVYKFKRRGNMPISHYLLQFRVLAQSSVIGCITIGMAYHMFNEHVLHKGKKE